METPNKEIRLISYLEDTELYVSLVQAGLELADEYYDFKSFKFFEQAKEDYVKNHIHDKPVAYLVDINLVGSSENGLEFIRLVNQEYGNGILIFVLSSSKDEKEKALAKKYGANGWIMKSSDLLDTIPKVVSDIPEFQKGAIAWKEYL